MRCLSFVLFNLYFFSVLWIIFIGPICLACSLHKCKSTKECMDCRGVNLEIESCIPRHKLSVIYCDIFAESISLAVRAAVEVTNERWKMKKRASNQSTLNSRVGSKYGTLLFGSNYFYPLTTCDSFLPSLLRPRKMAIILYFMCTDNLFCDSLC